MTNYVLIFQYFEGTMTDLDVLILGGFYGEGRMQSKISSFLVGILADLSMQGI